MRNISVLFSKLTNTFNILVTINLKIRENSRTANPILDALLSVIKTVIDKNGEQLEVLQEEAHKRGTVGNSLFYECWNVGAKNKGEGENEGTRTQIKTTPKETDARGGRSHKGFNCGNKWRTKIGPEAKFWLNQASGTVNWYKHQVLHVNFHQNFYRPFFTSYYAFTLDIHIYPTVFYSIFKEYKTQRI